MERANTFGVGPSPFAVRQVPWWHRLGADARGLLEAFPLGSIASRYSFSFHVRHAPSLPPQHTLMVPRWIGYDRRTEWQILTPFTRNKDLCFIS